MLPLATSTWDDKEYQALQDVIKSDRFTMGPKVAQFEQEFAAHFGSKYCVMVNSGSSANLLAIAALFFRKENPLKAGDEVIVPAVSWATTYYPLQQYGLKIKFVDVDIDTLNLDLNQLESAITDKTRVIFGVNLLGNCIDYPKLQSIIGSKDIIVLEDNCESLGSELEGKSAGSYGLMGTFSSFFSHHISTMEGGMIITDDLELYHILLSIRSHGWTRTLPDNNLVCEKKNDPFYESFRFVLPGFNVRPLEMSGALGIEQLKKVPSIVQGRRDNATVFQEIFGSTTGLRIQKEVGQSSWFGFSMLIEHGKEKRDEVVQALSKLNVDCRPIVAGNFTKNPVIKYFDYEIHGALPNSDAVHDQGLFIGNHHYPIHDELSQIHNTVTSLIS